MPICRKCGISFDVESEGKPCCPECGSLGQPLPPQRKIRRSKKVVIWGLIVAILFWVLFANPYILENPAWVFSKPSDRIIVETLPSARNVDYHLLKSLLQTKKWEEADRETGRILFKELSLSRVSDIARFPCTDLRTIDRLWSDYSQGIFGFSIQRKIVENDRNLPTPKELQQQCIKNCQGSNCVQGCLAERIRTEIDRIPEQMGRNKSNRSTNTQLPKGYYPSWGIYWKNSLTNFYPYTYHQFATRSAKCEL